jgi:multidrug transporter EmrE-like cation transporter
MKLSAVIFRLIGVVGICLFGLGVLTDTTAMTVVGGVLLVVAAVAGLLDMRRQMRK